MQNIFLGAEALPLSSQHRGLRGNLSSQAARRTGTAVLVMLHPMGCSSAAFKSNLDNDGGNFASILSDAGIDIVYPEGPDWSDPPKAMPIRYSTESEPTASFEDSYVNLLQPVLTELSSSYEQTFVAGHSMGGNMALQLLRLAPEKVDAIVSMKSFLFEDSVVWDNLQTPSLPVLMVGAQDDSCILFEDVEACYQRMLSKGVDVSLKLFPAGDHPLHSAELEQVAEWLADLV